MQDPEIKDYLPPENKTKMQSNAKSEMEMANLEGNYDSNVDKE